MIDDWILLAEVIVLQHDIATIAFARMECLDSKKSDIALGISTFNGTLVRFMTISLSLVPCTKVIRNPAEPHGSQVTLRTLPPPLSFT